MLIHKSSPTAPQTPAPMPASVSPARNVSDIDTLAQAEALWLVQPDNPGQALMRPRSQSCLARAAVAVRPFVPAMIGVAALGCLASQAAAAYQAFGIEGYPAKASEPTTRYFSSGDGTIQGEVVAPWDAESRYTFTSAQSICDNFLGLLESACQVVRTSTRGFNGTGLRMPAYFEPIWFVSTNVNTYNVSDALSPVVQCIFTQGNTNSGNYD